MILILSKKQESDQNHLKRVKKINIKLVLQNIHKLTITSEQKKSLISKTRFPIVVYKHQYFP
jgi:hypothetical protein